MNSNEQPRGVPRWPVPPTSNTQRRYVLSYSGRGEPLSAAGLKENLRPLRQFLDSTSIAIWLPCRILDMYSGGMQKFSESRRPYFIRNSISSVCLVIIPVDSGAGMNMMPPEHLDGLPAQIAVRECLSFHIQLLTDP